MCLSNRILHFSDLEPFGTIRAMLPRTHTSVCAKTFENLDLSFFVFFATLFPLRF